MREIWKVWKESYSKRYGNMIFEVSNFGRVKCNGEFYKCSICGSYYYLCGKQLHRIVAELFLPDWDPNKEVGHKDCNPLNNMVTNLYMCSHKENMNHILTRQHLSQCNKPVKQVLQYTLDYKLVNEFISTREAERQTKISHSHISKCCKNKYKSAGGYIWKYKEE